MDPNAPHGSSCVLLCPFASLWSLMVFLLVLISPYSSLIYPMGLYGSLRVLMGPYRSLCILMDSSESL